MCFHLWLICAMGKMWSWQMINSTFQTNTYFHLVYLFYKSRSNLNRSICLNMYTYTFLHGGNAIMRNAIKIRALMTAFVKNDISIAFTLTTPCVPFIRIDNDLIRIDFYWFLFAIFASTTRLFKLNYANNSYITIE